MIVTLVLQNIKTFQKKTFLKPLDQLLISHKINYEDRRKVLRLSNFKIIHR